MLIYGARDYCGIYPRSSLSAIVIHGPRWQFTVSQSLVIVAWLPFSCSSISHVQYQGCV